jgi:hypothetical protein
MDMMQYLKEIYPLDKQQRQFTIPAAVARYEDLYNALDPTPSPNRDLAPDVVGYLNQCSQEIPARYAIKIGIRVNGEARDERREREATDSIRAYYRHEGMLERAELRRDRLSSLRYVVIAVALLAGYALTQRWEGSGLIGSLLREALLIGGWVFLWESVTVNFIHSDAHRQALRRFERLVRAPVTFS